MKRGLIFPGGGMAQRDMMVVAKEAEAAGENESALLRPPDCRG